MEANKYVKTLKCIKNKYVIFGTECCICKKTFKNEQMWKTSTLSYFIGPKIILFDEYYCHNCAPTKEHVLFDIYTDYFSHGLFPIDYNGIANEEVRNVIIETMKEIEPELVENTDLSLPLPHESRERPLKIRKRMKEYR